jgi:hypothetical protein
MIVNEYVNACTEEGVDFDRDLLHVLVVSCNEWETKGLRRQTNRFKEIKKALIQEKVIRRNPLFWLPGFRTLHPLKMIIAAFTYYTFYSLVSYPEFVPAARAFLIYTFVSVLILVTNPLNLRNFFPFFKKKKYVQAVLVYVFIWMTVSVFMIGSIA